MSRTKQRVFAGSAAFVGVVAAVVLAIVGMPFGNNSPEAFAHSPCTDASCSVQPMHLHLDANLANGLCTTPYNATVAIGSSHQVGVCLEDFTANEVQGFDLYISNNALIDFGPDPQGAEEPTEGGGGPSCLGDQCLNDNPDANDGDSPGGTKLGGGWTCTPFGVVSPRSQVLPIHIACIADIISPDLDLAVAPGLLATITLSATAAGVDVMTFGSATVIDNNTVQDGSCGDVPDDLIGCFGASVTKVPDIGIVKTAVPNPAIAGSTVLFNTALSGGPGAIVAVLDDMDEDLVFNIGASSVGCTLIIPPGPPTPGVPDLPNGTNVVQCVGPFAVPGAGPIIAANVPLNAAGTSVSNGAGIVPGDPNTANDASYIVVPVKPAVVTISKVGAPAVLSVGGTVTWTVTVNNATGGSPASSVTITDTVDANQAIGAGDATINVGTCTQTGTTAAQVAGQTATCTLAGTIPSPGSVVMTVVADVVGAAGNACVDNATVDWQGNGAPVPASDDVVCLPPTVRMEKDIDLDATSIDNDVNLFITDPQVPLIIYELVSNPGNDPDGVGAYEFQLKFDHKIFDIVIENYPTPMQGPSWLSNGGTRSVTCDMTIITENDIRFGCVSSGPVPGQVNPGAAARITVYPEADLRYRLTPGQENGVFRVLLDENCELADVYGDPLRLADGSLAPGIVTGGLVAVCADMGITVRILEGDLNLDCVVNVLDEQAIAFRYGAFFGTLYYDPWFDLEPWNKDFDVDIKDLQKVWGRQGSVCEINGVGTIPPQLPVELP